MPVPKTIRDDDASAIAAWANASLPPIHSPSPPEPYPSPSMRRIAAGSSATAAARSAPDHTPTAPSRRLVASTSCSALDTDSSPLRPQPAGAPAPRPLADDSLLRPTLTDRARRFTRRGPNAVDGFQQPDDHRLLGPCLGRTAAPAASR